MVRKAASEGRRTSVTFRFSGARLHIRNRGMKPILHKKLKHEDEKVLFRPGNSEQKRNFVRNWWEGSCKCSSKQVEAVVEEEHTDRTIVALMKKS